MAVDRHHEASEGAPASGDEPAGCPGSPAEFGSGARSLRVCLVIGGSHDGSSEPDVDFTYVSLATRLQEAGHEVTLLHTDAPAASPDPDAGESGTAVDRGIRLVRLPESPVPLSATSPQLATSHRVYLWLRDHDAFDVVHFAERGGCGFYAMTARRQGLALRRTACVVGLFGASASIRRAVHDIIRIESQLECDYIERRSAEMADFTWSASGSALEWAAAEGWELPGAAGDRDIPGPDGWVRWHERLEPFEHPPALAGLPTISVCLNHYNRPHYLRQALDSLIEQKRAPDEVIVLDDGSPGEGVQEELDWIVAEYEFDRRGWRLVRERDLYLGASRNAAARAARSEYILFMDDDNVARSCEVATFAEVARQTGADVITCQLDRFEGTDRPVPEVVSVHRFLFAGAALPLCAIRNTFGDANALVRRRSLMEMGGYTEDRNVGHEDWEAYSRFALRGYRIEVIPESLFYYRSAPGAMTQRVSVIRNHLRSLRPHLEQIPRPYHGLIELSMGLLLARWGYFDPPPAADEPEDEPAPGPAPEPPPPLPLRYRIADAINDRVKAFRPIHRLARRLIVGRPDPAENEARAG